MSDIIKTTARFQEAQEPMRQKPIIQIDDNYNTNQKQQLPNTIKSSIDSGRDNPFKPDGIIYKSADPIVDYYKYGPNQSRAQSPTDSQLLIGNNNGIDEREKKKKTKRRKKDLNNENGNETSEKKKSCWKRWFCCCCSCFCFKCCDKNDQQQTPQQQEPPIVTIVTVDEDTSSAYNMEGRTDSVTDRFSTFKQNNNKSSSGKNLDEINPKTTGINLAESSGKDKPLNIEFVVDSTRDNDKIEEEEMNNKKKKKMGKKQKSTQANNATTNSAKSSKCVIS